MLHPVQGLGDGHGTDGPVSEQAPQRRQVGIGTQHPAHVGDVRLVRRLPRADQHVRLWINADDAANLGRDRQRQLAGATTKIDYEVLRAQLECVRQDVDSGGRIAVAIPVIELHHITAETQIHAHKSAIQGLTRHIGLGRTSPSSARAVPETSSRHQLRVDAQTTTVNGTSTSVSTSDQADSGTSRSLVPRHCSWCRVRQNLLNDSPWAVRKKATSAPNGSPARRTTHRRWPLARGGRLGLPSRARRR